MSLRAGTEGLSADSSSIVVDIADIASGRGGVVQRGGAVLERLHTMVRYDACFVALLHPGRREHLCLARSGYDARTCAYLDSADFMADVELLGLQRSRPPMRVCDLPVPAHEVRAWAEYLAPAGLREGVGIGLFTPDGRYLGLVGLHTESAVAPADATLDVLGALTPLIAHAVDPMRSVSAVAAVVDDAIAGVVVTRGGAAVLRAAAGQLAGGGVHATFLCPSPAASGPYDPVRVTALSAPLDPPYYFSAVVTVSPSRDLYGLTGRELEVLGLLVEGWPNGAIAFDLGITERTAAAHIEHILAKLGATSRTIAAVSALRLGLFVPRLLHGAPSAAAVWE
jgi:DNA-binding CsgD family transcriptional regulator